MNMKRLIYMISCFLVAVSCAQKLDNSHFIPGMGDGDIDPDQNASGPSVPDKILANQVKVISFILICMTVILCPASKASLSG